MRLRLCAFMVLVGSGVGVAQPAAPTPPVTEPGVIELPAAPVPLPPTPQPGAKVKLTGTAVYWFSTKTKCDVSAYPPGLLKVEFDEVPTGETLRLREVPFFDGTTTKTFKGPTTAYFVKASGRGDVQLTITPLGLKTPTDIKRVVFDVDSGTGPQPPPKPDDPPVPPAPVTSFRVIFVVESGTTDARATTVTGAKVVRDYLNEKCTKDSGRASWRVYDPQQATAGEVATVKSLWEAVRAKLPDPFTNCVAVEVNGKADIVSFPATPAAAVTLFDTYLKGGK